ncbi:hypothetical protein [Duganella sp. Dugasp56]|uniref:hypothetical protein n=1 Tax=Duganella sp. Dugasp56 TaxID=3243046 RepID=UPI0039AEE4FB
MSVVRPNCRFCGAPGVYCKTTYQYLDLCAKHEEFGKDVADAVEVQPIDWDVLVTETPHAVFQPISDLSGLPQIPGWSDMTWRYLVEEIYGFSVSDTGVDSADPTNLMRFTVGLCTMPVGRPANIQTIAADESHNKTAGCHEADFFGRAHVIHDEGILLIMQTHGPCGSCCNAFGAWARRRGAPIVVSFQYAKNVRNIKDKKPGTFVFMPKLTMPGTGTEAARRFYSFPYKILPYVAPKGEEKKAHASSSSSSSSSSSVSSTTTTGATASTSSGGSSGGTVSGGTAPAKK